MFIKLTLWGYGLQSPLKQKSSTVPATLCCPVNQKSTLESWKARVSITSLKQRWRLVQIPSFKIYKDLFYISAMLFERRNVQQNEGRGAWILRPQLFFSSGSGHQIAKLVSHAYTSVTDSRSPNTRQNNFLGTTFRAEEAIYVPKAA